MVQDLYRLSQINVRQGLDLVELRLGTHKIRLYYQTAFKICSKLQGSSCFAMRHEWNHPKLWRELAIYDRDEYLDPTYHEYRRSDLTSNVKDYSVAWDGSLVTLTFDELTAHLHYSDAAILCVWLRKAAKQAKRWAGDKSRYWNTYARLIDAEDNDKFRYI